MASSLRVFENMNRGVATIMINQGPGPCSPSNAKGYGQLHLPYLAFFTPPPYSINPRSSIFRAACPSSHQSEVAHPAFCHKPQTSDADSVCDIPRNKTLIAVVWAASKRLPSSHVNPFSGPHEAEPQDQGIGDRHANRRKNTMGWTCAA
jgi:hypothetical protein